MMQFGIWPNEGAHCSMEIAVPFPFKGRLVSPRSRKPRERVVIGRAFVDIPALTSAEAPPAVALEMATGDEVAGRDPLQGSTTRIVYRTLHGHLLRPCPVVARSENVADVFDEVVSRPTIQADLDRMCAAVTRNYVHLWPLVSVPGLIRDAVIEGDVGDQVITSDREERLKEFIAIMARAAFVEDILYVPSRGPNLRIHTRDTDYNGRYLTRVLGVTEVGWCSHHSDLKLMSSKVPLDRLEEEVLRRHQRTMEGFWHRQQYEPAPVYRARISCLPAYRIPELGGIGQDAYLRAMARTTLEDTKFYLPSLAPASVRCYASLRAATEGGSSEGVKAAANAFVAALREDCRIGMVRKKIKALAMLMERLNQIPTHDPEVWPERPSP
jgi:hypothetical protein